MEDLIVSVSSPPDIDIDIFTYWIEGRPSEEAGVYKIESLRKLNQTIGLEFPKINNDYYPNLPNQLDFIKYEVDDQYCLFTLLEHYLSIPQLLKIQTVCSISIDLQNVLIDKYWSLDDLFIREILNRKLINKNRKDIEEISEITGLNIRRITRQYDNLKKMFSLFEENSIHHHHNYDNLYSFISKTYLLNHHLSKKYTCILFLLYHKFTLTSKRRIQKLPCENLERCGALILTFLCMDHTTFFQGLASYDPPSDASWFENLQNGWNYVWKVFPAVSSYELDKQLLNNLRDFRAIMSGETLDVSCTLVRNRLTPPILRKLEGSSAQTSPSHGKLRNVIKSLLQLAANLSQSREFRDLFEDIITKIAEPLEESGLNVAEINAFLCACAYMEITEGGSRAMSLLKAPSEGTSTRSSLEHGTSISSFNLSNPKYASRNEHLKKDWLRFTTFTRMCLLQLVSSDRKL